MIARFLILLILAGVPSAALGQPASYLGRDGAAEARADLASRRPLTLYSHAFNGRAPTRRTPGLLNCDDARNTNHLRVVFIPEADWQEPEPVTPRQIAAQRYARAYNRVVFNLRGKEVREACPKVRLDPSKSR